MVILYIGELKNPTYFPLKSSGKGLLFYWSHCWPWPIKRARTYKNENTLLTEHVKKNKELPFPFLSLCFTICAVDICDERHGKTQAGNSWWVALRPHFSHVSSLPFPLSFFLFTASLFLRPLHTFIEHCTHIIVPSPCPVFIYIYTHTNTKKDQFHILFQDAEDSMSYCLYGVWSHLMQLCKWPIVIHFFFFLHVIFFFMVWYV